MSKPVAITKLDVHEINNGLRALEQRIDNKIFILDEKIEELNKREGELRERVFVTL